MVMKLLYILNVIQIYEKTKNLYIKLIKDLK